MTTHATLSWYDNVHQIAHRVHSVGDLLSVPASAPVTVHQHPLGFGLGLLDVADGRAWVSLGEVTETIKELNADDVVMQTLPRDELRTMTLPIVTSAEVLLRWRADAESRDAADEVDSVDGEALVRYLITSGAVLGWLPEDRPGTSP